MKLKRGLVGILICSLIGVSLPDSFLFQNYAIIADAATSLSASDEFIADAGITEGHVFDGSVETDSFEMNGRTYFTGILFNTTDSSRDVISRVDFNVESIDKFSCTFGHIDNGRTGYAEASVYLDNVLVDKFDMTSTMSLKDYSIDTSNSAVLRFSVVRKSGSAYAMANVTIDGIKPKKNYVIPEYSTSESFVDDSFNRYELSMRDAVSLSDVFEMNGRIYYKGVLFNTTDSSRDVNSRIDFNVESIDKFSCTFGHIDNGRTGYAEVSVYLDDVLVDKFDMTSTMPLKDYSIDTSDSAVLLFTVVRKSGSAYAMANVTIDGIKPKKNYVIPEYSTSESFVDNSFNRYELNMRDAVSEFDVFEMSGRTYYKGVLFNTTDSSRDVNSRIDFNVESINKFSCTFGHIDDGRTGYAEVSVYLDDVLVDKFDMTSTMPLKDYSIDTSDSAVLLFTVVRKSGSAYAMANVTIDGIKPEKNYVIPEYSTSESFVDDSFNRYELNMRDAVSEFDVFKMNGRIYYKGVLFNTTDSSRDVNSRIDFNVENVDEISFDIAHLDGGREGNATVSVYLDDVLAEEIELTPSMATKRYVLDVSTAKNVRFSVLRISGAAYAFADFDFVPATAGFLGDANGDGLVTIEDAVMLQKWLIAESKELTCWKNVDLCKDSRIDVFDLCLLRRMLIEK